MDHSTHIQGQFDLWFKNSEQWAPHSHCVLYDPAVIFLDKWGNIMVGLAYVLIPLFLLRLTLGMWREINPPTKLLIVHGAVFVLLCGSTHFVHAYNWTNTQYALQAMLEIVTGIISLWFAWRLFFYIRNRKWLLSVK
jgi:hypothetical protein